MAQQRGKRSGKARLAALEISAGRDSAFAARAARRACAYTAVQASAAIEARALAQQRGKRSGKARLAVFFRLRQGKARRDLSLATGLAHRAAAYIAGVQTRGALDAGLVALRSAAEASDGAR